MYKVIEKFKNCTVYNSEFTVNLWEASQEQLEHLFHLGHKGVEFVGSPLDPQGFVGNRWRGGACRG